MQQSTNIVAHPHGIKDKIHRISSMEAAKHWTNPHTHKKCPITNRRQLPGPQDKTHPHEGLNSRASDGDRPGARGSKSDPSRSGLKAPAGLLPPGGPGEPASPPGPPARGALVPWLLMSFPYIPTPAAVGGSLPWSPTCPRSPLFHC